MDASHVPDSTLTITEARFRLLSLPKRLAKEKGGGAVTVTHRGKPVLALVSWELYQTLLGTLEVLGDPDFMSALRQSIRQAAQGKTVPWEKAKRELDP